VTTHVVGTMSLTPLHRSSQSSMDADLGDRPLLEWQPADVHRWLSSIGFFQYELQLKGEFGIASCLCFSDSPQTTTWMARHLFYSMLKP